MKKKLSLLAIVVLVGVLVFVASISDWSTPQIPHEGPRLPGTSADRDVETVTETPQEGGGAEVVAPSSTAEAPRQSGVDTATQETADNQPERRLIIRDVDGRELHHENGEFVIETRAGSTEAHTMSVPFREGHFSLKGFPEGRARIEFAKSFSADGDRPIAVEEEWFEYKLDEPTLLTGHYLPDCTLRVVDARTGLSLNDVSVLPKLLAGPEQRHPGPHGPSSFVVRNRASPVRLPRTRGLQPYWVTARGYDWSFVVVDHEAGLERVVMLEPAGKLVVEVHGDIDTYMNQSLQVDIRVYSHDTRHMVTSSGLGPRGWQGFEGVAVGTYDVKVEVGPTGASPIVLGETKVQVTANTTSTARIELAHREALPRKVDVRGEIVLLKKDRAVGLFPSQRIQPAHGLALRYGDVRRFVTPPGSALRYRDVVEIKREAMDGRYEQEDGSEIFRWSAELSSGQYLFVVEPVQHGVVLDVPESPEANIRIVLPELFPVTLRVIDSKTRQSINGATIRWSRRFTERGTDGWVEMDLESGLESTTVYLTEGRFTFAASGPSYGGRSMDAHAGSGVQALTLELQPCIVREIILVDGETVIPWTPGMTCSVRGLGSDGSQVCENLGDGKMQACFERQGLYEIIVDRLEGLRQPAPVVVDVSVGDLEPIVVHLDH